MMMNPDQELFKSSYVVAFRSYARSVACHPINADQFAIGEGNGRISIHSIRSREQIRCIGLPQTPQAKNVVTSCAYSRCGHKLVCTLSGGSLCMTDVESGKTIKHFEDCAYKSQMRCGLAVDRSNDYLVASTDLGGKGVSLYDWRQALPIRSIAKVHLTWIPDMEFVPDDWPWNRFNHCLMTVCTDGQMKIISIDGKLVDVVDVGHIVHCCTLTPEIYDNVYNGYQSFATVGGECLTTVLPTLGLDKKVVLPGFSSALRMKFSSSGSRAFVGCDDGSMRMFTRSPQSLAEQKALTLHNQAISDLTISVSDEHVITTSEDGNCCVTKIGHPNHGATEWFEIA